MIAITLHQQCLKLYPGILQGEPPKSGYQRGKGENDALQRQSVIHNIYKQNLNLLKVIAPVGMDTNDASFPLTSEKDY